MINEEELERKFQACLKRFKSLTDILYPSGGMVDLSGGLDDLDADLILSTYRAALEVKVLDELCGGNLGLDDYIDSLETAIKNIMRLGT